MFPNLTPVTALPPTQRSVTTGVLASGFWWSQSDDKTNTTPYARLDLGHRRHGMVGVSGAVVKATSSVATRGSKPQRRDGESKDSYRLRLAAWLNKRSPSTTMWRRHRDVGHSERTARRREQQAQKRAKAVQ